MSTKQESGQASPWTEADYDEALRQRRELEDREIQHEFTSKWEQLRGRLVGLYQRKAALQNDLDGIAKAIRFHEDDQERLGKTWDSAVAEINTQRQREDQQRDMLVSQERERRANNANGTPTPKANGHHPADMANQPTGGWTSINGSRGRKGAARDDDDELPTDPGNLLSSGYQPAEDGEPNGKPNVYRPNGIDVDMDDSEAALAVRTRPLKPKQQQQQRHSLPGFHSEAGRDSPVDSKGRSPSGRRSLPGARAGSHAAEPNPQDQIEINRDTLVLKHNGTHYTEPAMYAGVPLKKISPGDDYWDVEWIPLEDHLKPQLEQWQEKLDKLRQDKTAVRHTVFLANRQVNRGQAVMDFLAGADPEFHPYQYVGKEMMIKFYKTFINYDTMFRLINVHEELKKFDLDVTPLEWLRHRMYEVATAQGDKFNLSKYTHDLYHDAKLKILREKHGFGNIGRPSGYKVGEKNPDKGKAKIKREQLGLAGRRKVRRSIGQVDMDDTQSLDGFPQQQQPPQEFLDPVTPRMQKRQRLEAVPPMVMMPPPQQQQQQQQQQPEPAPPAPEVDDLEFDGWTSSDSFSAGRISVCDFRVHQIKTSQLTTSTEVTQYWTWKQNGVFEHQVLRDVHPKVTWGYYQKPINFDINLAEVIEVLYARSSQKVVVRFKDSERGDVLAFFKRERTRNRFLSFLRKRNIVLTKSTPEQLEDAWNSVKSDTLPGDE
ncbi:hypothetical protein JX265_006994 [Neoarthrinium moseri]|uniref:Uncharacterized protein n=1 Tax=Neoarthrinium moseri TaxID=1658444 RepID=A0A9P9WKH1_9PEZI|nr:hypothetical protein JX265_006994 [Neoarthrinium moseri]